MYNNDLDDEDKEEKSSFLKTFYYNNKILVWIFIGIIVFILLMSLLTKGGSNGSKEESKSNYEVSIYYPEGDVTIAIGRSVNLYAKVEEMPQATIIWSVDNPDIIKVDNGNVMGLNYGKRNIHSY